MNKVALLMPNQHTGYEYVNWANYILISLGNAFFRKNKTF